MTTPPATKTWRLAWIGAVLAPIAIVLAVRDPLNNFPIWPEVSVDEAALPCRGSLFFDGVGFSGAYVTDIVAALAEAGISQAEAAGADTWSSGSLAGDALAVPLKRSRDRLPTGFTDCDTEGIQFNLIGYSYGSLVAAQAAADHAEAGGQVDHLVLIAAPIGEAFLKELRATPGIGKVVVVDLGQYGDPITAGLAFTSLMASFPRLAWQFLATQHGRAYGHFYYTDVDTPAGAGRRRELAQRLHAAGLR